VQNKINIAKIKMLHEQKFKDAAGILKQIADLNKNLKI
jgi:hypothetical protein